MANARQKVNDILFGIFGKGFDDLPPSVQAALLNSSDMNEGLRAAREEMQRLASQRSIGTNAPGRSPLEADYINYPRDNPRTSPQVTVNTGRAEQPKVPVAPEADARPAQPSFLRKVLTPLSMDVPRREFLPGDFRPDDTAGDAVRKILGYGAIPGAAVGMAARQLADGGGYFAATYPWGDDTESAEGQSSEEERRAASKARIEAQRERHFQEIMAERFRRKPGMASPRE